MCYVYPGAPVRSFSPEYLAYMQLGRSLGHGTWAERRARYWRPAVVKQAMPDLPANPTVVPAAAAPPDLTYTHIGNEWWFELRLLCAWSCHSTATAVSRALRPAMSNAAVNVPGVAHRASGGRRPE
ncbi:MAG TPA: hypothetical protein VNT27_04425 [Propionibacteriaceae bacterium]|nr:hypothetical protein [Propionibacteriaceae bacterium]